MSVSVVIPTVNRSASLLGVLDALRRQTFRDFDVIVVNGPSTDDTAQQLARLGDAIRVLDNPERNLSLSRNLGIEAAAGELVAFLDDDAVPEPRWLEELIEPFGDPRVAGAGGLVLDHTGVAVQWRHLVVSRAGDHDFDQLPPLDRFVAPGADPFLYVAGGNSAFRRAALAEVGGFDEEIEYNFDEAEVCLRLLDAGWSLASLESAVVHHRSLPSHLRSEIAFTDPFFDVKNRVYFALRNGPDRGVALASANRDVDLLRVRARGAARAGRLSQDGLATYLGRSHAGFHVGLRRGMDGGRRGRSFAAPTAAVRRYPTLAPESRRRVATTDPHSARALADAGHEVHLMRLAAAQEPYRIDVDRGVWIHVVPVRPRRLPEVDGAAVREPLERAAALRAALDRVARREPVEVEAELPPPLEGFLEAGEEEVAAMLRRAGVHEAERVAPRLLQHDRFPTDHERDVIPCLAEPDDERFLDCVYAALLGRPPEAFGRAMSLAQLREGLDRNVLVERIARSPEARGRGVDATFLDRLPPLSLPRAQAALRSAWLEDDDARFARLVRRALVGEAAAEGAAADAAWSKGGAATDAARPEGGAAADAVAGYAARLAAGTSRRDFVAELVGRADVAERIPGAERLPPGDVRTRAQLRAELRRLGGLTDAEFVAGAHRLLLGRDPDPVAAARYRDALAGGDARAWLLGSLARTPEAEARGVRADVVDALLRWLPRYRIEALWRSARRRLSR